MKPTADQLKASDLLASRATHIGLGGGSRSGKTFWFLRAIAIRANLAPGSRHGVFRFRANALTASVVEDTWPKMLDMWQPGLYNPNSWKKSPNLFYEFPNGSQVWFAGLDDKDRVEKILGQEFATMFFNECSQIPWQSVVTAMSRLAQKVIVPEGKGTPERELSVKAYYDFNPPSKRHWTYLQFIEKQDPLTRKPVRDELDYVFMKMNPEGNKENLSVEYLNILNNLPEKARNRFLLGLFADDSDGSLWTDEVLEQQRFLPGQNNPMPMMVRIVIAVDPSGCSGEEDFRSDEVGITVVGLAVDGKAYLLEDLSGRYGPNDWARVVNSAFDRHSADKVIAEQNYGGEMVRTTLQAENPHLPVGLVSATRGKVVRAEPISHLYEKDLVRHVGYFPEVEDQLCSFTVRGYEGPRSPDRADSVIWAVTELFPSITEKKLEDWVAPTVNTPKRSASRYAR